MAEFAQAPNSLELSDRVRFFFSTRSARDSNGQYISRVGFVDFEKEDLGKQVGISQIPVLELGSIGDFDEFGTYPFSTVRINDDIYAAYGGWTRCDSVPFDVSIGIAKASVHDLEFKKIGRGPQLTKTLYEPFIISSPKIRYYNNKFYLFYIAGSNWNPNDTINPVYSIRVATSDDGIRWTKMNKNLIENILGPHEAQASPDVIYLNGYYHMFFSFREGINFKESGRGYRMGYAFSDDLTNWVRDDSLSNLKPSCDGWDSEDISYPHVFKLNGKLNCAYLGSGIGRTGFGYASIEGLDFDI